MLKSLLEEITPQGRILLLKALLGALLGATAHPLLSILHMSPRYFFLLTIAAYTLLSYATVGLAKRANPPVDVYLYAFFKGFLTYYVALLLVWFTVYAVLAL